MKKVFTILAAALFLGACHCTKCTMTPNRSNMCANAAVCQKHHHKKGCKCNKCKKENCFKPVVKQAPVAKPAPAPAPKPVAKVADDAALAEVVKVNKKADNISVLSFKEPVLFGHNSDVIQDQSYPQLRKTANALKKYPNAQVRVAGYTDSLGDPAYNVDLSQRRAKAVADQLVKYGVPAENVSSVGFGAANPVATNKTKIGRAANRRVELEVTNK